MFKISVITLFAILFLQPVSAALPQQVNGEHLPSLASMVKEVAPAVVNIATRRAFNRQQSPLLNDSFFRHFFKLKTKPVAKTSNSLGSGGSD